ncbi:MAG: cysteine-rich small domain-containing protein [Holophagales bacterium]|jgi:Zn-finger protein|nr:cysteine-rich small domain-containing protein [Holophagales bacterium]
MTGEKESKGKKYMFFSHRECEAFPCHPMKDLDNFNCLFCYCPLYILGLECGGNFVYLDNGMKDCTNCTLPHQRENYGAIVARFEDIRRKMLASPAP